MHGSNKNPDGQARRNGIGSGVGVSVFIFCFALLMRLFYLYGARQAPTFLVPIIDSQSYLELARRMVAHLPTGAQMYWQPVFYPAFLATVIALFGESLWLIKIIQAVIGASTCVLLYWTGRLGLSAREGLLAGLLMALYGPVLFFESELLGEGWALFWVCALLLSFLLAERTDHPLRYALAGLIGGCAVLTRPPLLMVFVFCALRLCWVQYRRTNLREAFACGGLILIAFAVICSHTAYRCKAVTGKLSFLPHSAGINLYIGNNPDWRETVCARPGYEWQRLCNLPTDAGVTNEWAASGFFQQEVKHYALEHPGLFIRGLLHKTVRFFNSREMPRNISIYTYREWSPLLALTTWK
ncbi:MAG: hypothetical protein EOM20_16525, partial [Spartobacteria bacterium]|nr:hypothetical protein [Spartobacteria bacterium]